MEPDCGWAGKANTEGMRPETRQKTTGIPEQPDPFPKVPPSLLSAKHIKDYVLKTGAIAPFYDRRRQVHLGENGNL